MESPYVFKQILMSGCLISSIENGKYQLSAGLEFLSMSLVGYPPVTTLTSPICRGPSLKIFIRNK